MTLSQEQIEKITKTKGIGESHELDEMPKGHLIYDDPRKAIPENKRIYMAQAQAILARDSRTENPRTTTYLGIPILQEHSIKVFCRKVLKYIQFKQFCSLSNVGKSGAGKSTFAGNFIHEFHKIATKEHNLEFTIKHVGKDELIMFDKWLAKQTHVNTIFVF